MAELGYVAGDLSDPDSALGADAAQAGLDFRETDGANESGHYADGTGYAPVNTPYVLLDPNRWQPLMLPNGTVQSFLVPHWGRAVPFALVSADQFRPTPPCWVPVGSDKGGSVNLPIGPSPVLPSNLHDSPLPVTGGVYLQGGCCRRKQVALPRRESAELRRCSVRQAEAFWFAKETVLGCWIEVKETSAPFVRS
jgi:hypothetical protein